MKKITLIAALFATAFTGACGMLTKEQEELLIPLLDQRVQFVPVSPDAFADGQIYFMEDWAEWDSPDDRPVFYLGRGSALTKVPLPYLERCVWVSLIEDQEMDPESIIINLKNRVVIEKF